MQILDLRVKENIFYNKTGFLIMKVSYTIRGSDSVQSPIINIISEHITNVFEVFTTNTDYVVQ